MSALKGCRRTSVQPVIDHEDPLEIDLYSHFTLLFTPHENFTIDAMRNEQQYYYTTGGLAFGNPMG